MVTFTIFEEETKEPQQEEDPVESTPETEMQAEPQIEQEEPAIQAQEATAGLEVNDAMPAIEATVQQEQEQVT